MRSVRPFTIILLMFFVVACETEGPVNPDVTPAVNPAVVAGAGFSCALDLERGVFCWGRNDRGQLGRGTVSDQGGFEAPGPVAGGHEFRSLSAGDGAVCGLSVDDEVLCWGDGRVFGDQAGSVVPTPTVIATTVADFVRVSTGGLHGCGLTTSGDGTCWGTNDIFGGGQLGDGTVVSSATATTVAEVADFAFLQAGFLHTCGVTSRGGVRCWGSNALGALGLDAATAAVSTPTPVPGVPTATALATGSLVTCVLDQGGTAWCWGTNEAGQLGRGILTAGASGPNRVLALTAFVALALPTVNRIITHTCAITAQGEVWCWGANDAGQLGREGTQECTLAGESFPCDPTAAPVPGFTFRQVAAGANHTCGVTVQNRILCWGSDAQGQLGGTVGGTTITPVEVELGG